MAKTNLTQRIFETYRDGADGFIKWAEDNVNISIYPAGSSFAIWVPIKDLPDDRDQYGRSYRTFWENQKDVIRQALAMENGQFRHRLIVFCWQRGDGKSFLACLIQLWKFFCFPKQQIMLGANSKDQVKFVHYDIIRDIIKNSPRLLAMIGDKQIQEKEVRAKNKRGDVVSKIRSISSFTGIVSNITGYTFSEMFDMKDPKFFVQLDGSVRNIPNAIGVIDSTVSSKQHVLYQLYKNQTEIDSLFFSYRYSKSGDPRDYWNPNMSQQQLDDYKVKFPFGEYERYFLNLWDAGADRMFTDTLIEATNYFGADGLIGNHRVVTEIIDRKLEIMAQSSKLDLKQEQYSFEHYTHNELGQLDKRLIPVSSKYQLKAPHGSPAMATAADLDKLSDLYDTNWAVIAGVDRADPVKTRTFARTILTFVAKGLPGSRSNPILYDRDGAVPEYVYLLLHISNVEDSSLEGMKAVFASVSLEFEGIDKITAERWGAFDLIGWCEDNNVKFETVYPNYQNQRGAFGELFILYKTGRFKTPPIGLHGSKKDDILKEEAEMFDHDSDKHWFGSPQKQEKYGVQDDAMYSLAWCVWGGKELNISDLRPRKGATSFGVFINP